MPWSSSLLPLPGWQTMANAQVPANVVPGLALARLTALRKPDGGVHGIATGDVFRCLVSRALAKGWATTFDRATP